jgi:hypothetical protein
VASAGTVEHRSEAREDISVMDGRYEELEGYTVSFETCCEDAEATPLFEGLPEDRCQSPHRGDALRGEVERTMQIVAQNVGALPEA